ncbi:outer membrane beta-barrel protein [Lewinella sp. W8]|uniref:outer membrane beta-barrel protein n=1 Tax=Lewinella sp. W8 TaxID=2528208 RepID=UPI001067EE57|nr:outer membrane beta-barrel protein [Lewinella sp. W8]MTB49388.1 outer membrane beta-barrel protein [Lewinella sp. W8]
MKNTQKVSLLALLFFFSFTLSSQTDSKWSVGLQAGIADYLTFSDFQEVVYTIEGNDYLYSLGNITESNLGPALGLEVGLDINPRWRLTGFAQFQTYSGRLYENDFAIFGVSSTVPEPVEFRAPADNKLTAFQLGVQVQYCVLQDQKLRGYLGAGFSFLSRSHEYRNRLEVDFTEDRRTNSLVEFFTTANRNALALPLSARLEKDLSENIFVSLTGQLTVFPNLEDHQIAGLIGLHYRL